MAANPLFSVLAVLSLALGIGANAAIYSFMDALLVRSLPVAEPERLVTMNWNANFQSMRDFVMHGMSGSSWGNPRAGTTSDIFPHPAFDLFRKNDSIFSSVFGYYQQHAALKLNLTIHGAASLARGQDVTGEFFSGLGVPPAAGRLFIPDDDLPGRPAIAVASYALAEARLGGAAAAPGQSILIDNRPFTVVGVTPPEFFGVDPAAAPDLYLPLHIDLALRSAKGDFGAAGYLDANFYWIQVMARLRPGVSLQQAQAVLGPQFQQWVETTAHNDVERAHLPALRILPAAGGLGTLRRQYSKPLYVLLTLVALILAIACANVANLLLARSAARRREMALRLSVGAGRWRVVRQLLTESVLLSSVGGVLGVALALWGIRFLTLLLAGGRAQFTLHAELNWRVLGVAAALSIITGVVFGLVPASQATRVDVAALKESRVGRDTGRSLWGAGFGRGLMVGQIALSLLMLVAAGLFVRTLSNLQSIDLGFTREHVLLFRMNALKAGHRDPEIASFYGGLRDQFSRIPGVRQASLSNAPLLEAGWGLPLSRPGAPPDDRTRLMSVGPGYFTTMQIPLLAGRDIEDRDQPGSPQVAVINQEFARLNFPGESPVGEHLILWGGPQYKTPVRDMQIVGVAKDAHYGGLKSKTPPVVFFPYDQGKPAPGEMVFALRTAGNPLAYVAAVREIARHADSRVPVDAIQTQAAEIDATITEEIVLARLCTVFALLALAIACVGLYGTVAYNVARRTGEIGIRMALGAQRARLIWMVLREVLALAALGIAISVPAALAASKLVESMLFEMKGNDPWAVASAVATLLAAALLAAWLPARKAARVDPMVALRNE